MRRITAGRRWRVGEALGYCPGGMSLASLWASTVSALPLAAVAAGFGAISFSQVACSSFILYSGSPFGCCSTRYQKLRQEFLNSLTVDMLNQYLRQQLSQDMALVLQQPKGEPEYNMNSYCIPVRPSAVAAPAPCPARAAGADTGSACPPSGS